jgi:hypothetical protein
MKIIKRGPSKTWTTRQFWPPRREEKPPPVSAGDRFIRPRVRPALRRRADLLILSALKKGCGQTVILLGRCWSRPCARADGIRAQTDRLGNGNLYSYSGGELREMTGKYPCSEIMCLSNCKSLAGKGLCLRRRSRLTRGGFSEQG